MTSDLYVQIRQKFDTFIDEAKKHAAKRAALSIDVSELEKQTPERQVGFLQQQLQKLHGEIDHFETAEYYYFAGNEMLIYKLFSFRLLCNEKNEEQNIRDGFFFFEKHNLLQQLLLKAKKQLVPYTIKDFLENRENEMLYELDEQPDNTPDLDYLLIREWQTTKKADCTFCGFYLIRENFLRAVEKRKNTGELVKAELANLENIVKNVTDWEPEKLVEELVKIRGLKDLMLPGPTDVFYSQLCSVIKGDRMNRLLSPLFLEDTLQQVSDRRICNPLVFYLTLLMYGRWLNDVLKGKADISQKEPNSFHDLFYQSVHEGLALGKIAVEKSKRKYHTLSGNAEHHKQALIHAYHEQFSIFSKLVYAHYFDFLENEKKLKNAFVNDCLSSLHVGLPVEELKRAIVLNEMIEFLDEEISLVCHNPLAPFCDVPFDRMQLVEILCHLAPETAQIKQLMDLLTRVARHCHNERIPVCFINNELNDSFTLLFKQAVIKYKHRIERMNTDKRGRFISEQLRDIKYMLRLCEIEHKKLSPFYRHVKHILKDESKSTHQMYPYRMMEINEPVEIKKVKVTKSFSFNYRPGPRPLRPIVAAMNLEFDLFGGSTTVDDFMEVLMCRDLSKNTKIIQLAAKYNLIEGLRKRLLPWCSNLKPVVMERSGIFTSLKEGPLKAASLYKSTPLLPEVCDKMEKIFMEKKR